MARDQAQYMRDYRKTPSGQDQVRRAQNRALARRTAVKKLIERHQNEFDALLEVEVEGMRRSGLI